MASNNVSICNNVWNMDLSLFYRIPAFVESNRRTISWKAFNRCSWLKIWLQTLCRYVTMSERWIYHFCPTQSKWVDVPCVDMGQFLKRGSTYSLRNSSVCRKQSESSAHINRRTIIWKTFTKYFWLKILLQTMYQYVTMSETWIYHFYPESQLL